MAVGEKESGSKSLSPVGTETSALNATSPETTDGAFQLVLDLNTVAKGDVIEIYIKEKVISGGTARQMLLGTVANDAEDVWFSVPLILCHGWDFTMKQTAGTARTIPWSIRNA